MNITKIVELLEDLKAEDLRKRVAAVKGLDKIAEVFGVEKTKTMLLPFLKEFEDDEEEVMLELAKQMLFLGRYINENGTGVIELVPHFFVLLNYEDLSVINEAMRSLEGLVRAFSISHESILQLAKRLLGINSCKAAISAVKICCQLAHAVPNKFAADVSKIISDSAGHKATLVRKETASALRFLLEEASPYESLASSTIKKLLKDAQESVRVAAVESITFRRFPKPYFTTSFHGLLLPLLE